MKIRYNIFPTLSKFFISILIFRIVLDISYIAFLSVVYESDGYIADINIIKLIESYLVLFLVFYFLPKATYKLSLLIIQLFLLFTYLPIQSLYALSNQERVWFWYATIFWLFIFFLYNKLHYRWKIKLIPKIAANISTYKVYIYLLSIASIFSLASFILLSYYTGISFNLDLTKVYEIRERFVQLDIPFSGYILNWSAKILLPFIALFSLFYHKQHRLISLFLFSFILTLLFFSATGHKTYLFTLPAVLGMALLIRMKNIFSKIITYCIILLGISLLLFLLLDVTFLGSLFVRRMFFVPAQLSFYYYDFFKENELVYLSHSIFSSFSEYPYDLPPSNLISKIYFDDPEMSSNNGILTDGFMNFGLLGIFIWGLLLIILLKLTDRIVEMKNRKVLWPLIILSYFTMVNGAFLTTLLTHGLLVVLLIAFIYPKEIHTIEK